MRSAAKARGNVRTPMPFLGSTPGSARVGRPRAGRMGPRKSQSGRAATLVRYDGIPTTPGWISTTPAGRLG